MWREKKHHAQRGHPRQPEREVRRYRRVRQQRLRRGQVRSREANIKGRKRHILTDTLGHLLGVLVTPASVQDRDAARVVCCLFCHLWLSLRVIFADGGYAGKLEGFVAEAGRLFGHAAGLLLCIIKRSDRTKGFAVLPKRWVVERTFGWLVKSRRLVRDHERNPRHHEAFVYLAMIGHSTRALTSRSSPLSPR